MREKPPVDNSPEIARAVRETLGLSPRTAGPPREVQALRLIAQRAQAAGPEDADEALTWIYRMASSTADALDPPATETARRLSPAEREEWIASDKPHRKKRSGSLGGDH